MYMFLMNNNVIKYYDYNLNNRKKGIKTNFMYEIMCKSKTL